MNPRHGHWHYSLGFPKWDVYGNLWTRLCPALTTQAQSPRSGHDLCWKVTFGLSNRQQTDPVGWNQAVQVSVSSDSRKGIHSPRYRPKLDLMIRFTRNQLLKKIERGSQAVSAYLKIAAHSNAVSAGEIVPEIFDCGCFETRVASHRSVRTKNNHTPFWWKVLSSQIPCSSGGLLAVKLFVSAFLSIWGTTSTSNILEGSFPWWWKPSPPAQFTWSISVCKSERTKLQLRL